MSNYVNNNKSFFISNWVNYNAFKVEWDFVKFSGDCDIYYFHFWNELVSFWSHSVELVPLLWNWSHSCGLLQEWGKGTKKYCTSPPIIYLKFTQIHSWQQTTHGHVPWSSNEGGSFNQGFHPPLLSLPSPSTSHEKHEAPCTAPKKNFIRKV